MIVGVRESHDWQKIALLGELEIHKSRHDTKQEAADNHAKHDAEYNPF